MTRTLIIRDINYGDLLRGKGTNSLRYPLPYDYVEMRRASYTLVLTPSAGGHVYCGLKRQAN